MTCYLNLSLASPLISYMNMNSQKWVVENEILSLLCLFPFSSRAGAPEGNTAAGINTDREICLMVLFV